MVHAAVRAVGRAPARDDYFAERRRIFDEIVPAAPMRGIRDVLDAAARRGDSDGDRFVGAGAVGGRRRSSGSASGRCSARWSPATKWRGASRRPTCISKRRAGSASIPPRDCDRRSAPGIAAARAAGMKTVAIPHWLTERHDLSGADLTVAHAGELTLDRLVALEQSRAARALSYE